MRNTPPCKGLSFPTHLIPQSKETDPHIRFWYLANLKSNIRFLWGIQSKNNSLYYSGKLVEDSMIVASLEIQNGATLQMVTNPNHKLSISVETLNGGTVDVEIRCWHTVD
ncbi:hypothetical protein Q3G72_004689 [Acer saccharum]|nr:hypothetical protein Q3G72_004689 [Acer saccharum]